MTHTHATKGQRGIDCKRLLTRGRRRGGLGILVLAGLLLLPAAAVAQEAGDLDVTFGSEGKVTTEIMGTAFAAALQTDGKIVVAGGTSDPNTAGTGNADFGLARFLSDGSPDLTFGGDGHVTTDLGSYEAARAVLLQPDGKIVAVGSAIDPFDSGVPTGIAMARYNPNGTLDTTFGGGDGIVIGGIGGAWAAVLQPDGKIVVAGGGTLARYLSNGTLDATFGGGGQVTTAFGFPGGYSTYAVALQPDGKIVVAGQVQVSIGDEDFALSRYNSNGTLDTTFSGGQVSTDFLQSQDRATGIALQPDGKIVAAGFVGSGIPSFFALARYNPNGTLDATFDGDGRVTTFFPIAADLFGVALQPDGKIVAAGFVVDSAGERRFALARYRSDGTLDTTFGGGGRVTTDIGDGDTDIAWAILLQPDGKIVAVGQANTISNEFPAFALARYESEDVPDGDPKVVNDLVQLTSLTQNRNLTPVPGGPAGTLTIQATFKNASSTGILMPFFVVTALSNGNLLLNADGGPGAFGAKLTPNVGADGALTPGESVVAEFVVGLRTSSGFTFFVDLWGQTNP